MQLSLPPLVVSLVSSVGLQWAGFWCLSRDLWLSPSVLQGKADSHLPSLLAALESYLCSSEGSRALFPSVAHLSSLSTQAQSVMTIIAKPFDIQWTSMGWCICIIEDWIGCAYQIQSFLFPDSSSSCSILQLVHFANTEPALGWKSEWTLARRDIFSCVKLGFHNVAKNLTVLFCSWLYDSMYTWHCSVHTLGPFTPE